MAELFVDTELGEMLHENEEQITRQIAEAIAAKVEQGPRYAMPTLRLTASSVPNFGSMIICHRNSRKAFLCRASATKPGFAFPTAPPMLRNLTR
jgi:hypothetical protein